MGRSHLHSPILATLSPRFNLCIRCSLYGCRPSHLLRMLATVLRGNPVLTASRRTERVGFAVTARRTDRTAATMVCRGPCTPGLPRTLPVERSRLTRRRIVAVVGPLLRLPSRMKSRRVCVGEHVLWYSSTILTLSAIVQAIREKCEMHKETKMRTITAQQKPSRSCVSRHNSPASPLLFPAQPGPERLFAPFRGKIILG